MQGAFKVLCGSIIGSPLKGVTGFHDGGRPCKPRFKGSFEDFLWKVLRGVCGVVIKPQRKVSGFRV